MINFNTIMMSKKTTDQECLIWWNYSDTIIVNRHYTFAQTHRMYNSKSTTQLGPMQNMDPG